MLLIDPGTDSFKLTLNQESSQSIKVMGITEHDEFAFLDKCLKSLNNYYLYGETMQLHKHFKNKYAEQTASKFPNPFKKSQEELMSLQNVHFARSLQQVLGVDPNTFSGRIIRQWIPYFAKLHSSTCKVLFP